MKSFLLTSAAFALCVWSSPQLRSQTTDLTATIQFGNGQSAVINDFSDEVGVQPNQAVTVTISFPSDAAGEPVQIASLDGGIVNGLGVIDGDGTLAFGFEAPGNTGQIRIVIRHGLKTVRLLFWVLSSNPENNPPVVTPANQ